MVEEYKQLAEEFVAGISDLVEQGDEMLETPPGEEKDLNYVITALDNIVGGASRNLLASRLSAVDGVEQGAATLVDGLLDGLKSGNLLAEIPAILGQTGNTLAYAEAQAFLDQIGSGLGGNYCIEFIFETVVNSLFFMISLFKLSLILIVSVSFWIFMVYR